MNKLKRFLALVLAMSMMLTLVPFGVLAAEAPTTNLSTTGSPFQKGTGGSNSFRIPAIVTLSDGTLVAAADARWNTTYDGGGLDTMVAVSTDDGATWTHSFANYLGDNDNSYNYNSTCFIDPSLAVTDDDTIYMLCDLYPYGVALNGNGSQTAPAYDTGFNSDGYLALSADNHGSYSYYLKNGKIYSGETAVDGLTVDAHFNVTGTYNGTTYDTNLFFSDSPFKVARTGFLYLTKSTDKGATWSNPTLLPLKTDSEQVCLVGPGRGLVTESGTIVFPAYTYSSGSYKYTSLIYSEDGVNWERSGNVSLNDSSEATMVELTNGRIRTFMRNELSQLVYADFNLETGNWGASVQTGVAVNSDTELSAISYSKTVGGEQVILVSAPTGPNAAGSNNNDGSYRTSGKIFAGIVSADDYTMTWKSGSVAVTPVATGQLSGNYTAANGFFSYSCLTEMDNNSVAIIYEDNQYGWGAGDNNYYTLAYKTYTESELQTAFGVTFDGNTSSGGDTDDGTTDDGTTDDDTTTDNTVDVTLKVGETANKTITGVSLNGSYTDNVAEVTWVGSTYATATLGSDNTYSGETINVANCLYTFTKNDAGNWVINRGDVYLNTNGSTGFPHGTSSAAFTIEAGNETGTFYIRSTSNNYLYFDRSAKNWNRVNTLNNNATWMANCSMSLFRVAQGEGSGEIYGYEKVTSVDAITEGQYLIGAMASDNNWYIAYPSTVTTTRYNQIAKVTGETVNTNPGTEVTVAKGQLLSDSSKVDISKCLFTFTNHAETGYYVIESASVAGKYLNNIMADSSANVPFSATAGKVAITLGHTDMFQFKFNAVTGSTYGGTPSLHFHTEQATPYWNRCGTDTNATCYEYLYRAVKTGEESSTEIPGYIRMTSLDQITSGEQYLIAHTNGTNYYVLYPGTSQYGCVAQVVTETATVAEDTTAVTIKGVAPGYTEVKVGTTQYNITVNSATATAFVDVELKVGETQKFTETSGAYTTAATAPDASIVGMTLQTNTQTGEATYTVVDALESGEKYLITINNNAVTSNTSTGYNGNWSSAQGLLMTADTTDQEQHLWTITQVDGGYTFKNADGKYLNIAAENNNVTLSDDPVVLSVIDNGTTFTIHNNNYALNDFGGWNSFASCWEGTSDANAAWTLKKYSAEVTTTTEVSFTGVSAGKTVAVVGNTQYNLTVTNDKTIVNLEVEVGETVIYTDTTGNYENATGKVDPDGTYATMEVAGTTNTVVKKLVPVTASTFETGKRYVIENVRTANQTHAAYQPAHSVLTSTEAYGGLLMNGPLDAASSQTWSFTPSDNMYLVGRNGEYITISNGGATMETTAQSLSFEYVDGSGWLIYYNTDGNNTSDDGDYFLSDVNGTNSGEAFGYATKNDDGNYWNIYELQSETLTDATKVSFTGVAEGKTTATVGSTTYNITVVAAETDDEVINSATNTWTVDPEIQRQRYNALTGLAKDLYTDDSWKAYETARTAAYKKLVEVSNAKYASEAEAQAALEELTALIDALETAHGKLVSAKTISVRYNLDGTVLDTREYKIASTETSLDLPETIVVGDYIYAVGTEILDLTGETGTGDTAFDVPVTLIGKQGGGFVGSQDIDAGTHENKTQICDLVVTDDEGNITSKKKITEMTLTVGISYNLDLATDTTGYTVEWVSDNSDIATVDQDGNVTAVAVGTTYVTATVKDANGNVVEVNTIPVTVYPKGTGDRTSAIYIEEVANTTVWCVVNADTDAYAFEVIEGELIYGQFDTTVSDGNKTTAFSFFGDPDEAHALVYMKSTNSHDHYYLLHDDNGNLYDGTESGKASEAYYVSGNTSGAGWWQAVGLNDNNQTNEAWRWDIVKEMVQWAILEGCDGGMGFTRRLSEGDIGSNLSFASDPMPRIEKTVNGVLPTSRKMADFRRYTDGMVAAVHELVYFQIDITQEVPTVWTDANETVGAISYTGASILDTALPLPYGYLYTKELDQADGTWDGEVAAAYRVQEDDITDELNTAWTDEQKAAGKRVFSYYLVYEIQESDIPKFYIDNIAELSYNYKSYYSSGAQKGTADAEARISVVGSAIDNVVIDFGQSFVYEGHEYTSITDGQSYTFEGLTNVHLKGAYVDGENDEDILNADGTPRTTSKATAKYGDVKVTRTAILNEDGTVKEDDKGYTEYTYTVTYTPNQILLGVDTVLIYGYGDNNQEKIINGFLVYPATTVYYEEGFILNDDSTWSNAGSAKATVNQTFELLGASQFNEHGELTHKVSNKKHAYGYDPIYNGDGTNDVAKSAITSSTIGDSTTFTFIGNGFEIFADSTDSTGKVSVQVKNSAGKFVKVFTVDTAATEGYTGVTVGQTVNLDSLPIVSWHSDNHDTYTVTVQKIAENEPVVIDGVRIFNTLNEADYNNEDGTSNSPFIIDLEDDPDFYQLRDYVLYAVGIDNDTSVDYREMCDQVYELMGDAQSAVILDAENPYASVIDSKVYTTTTTKTTVTTVVYNDGTSVVVTRVDTHLEEYSDEAKTELILVRDDTEDTTVYKNADGEEISREDFGDVTKKTIVSETSAAPVEMTVEDQKTVLTAQDLLDNGPKNELYLHKGESLVFKVSTNRMMQIGLKAPQGSATYSLQYAVNENEAVKVAENAVLNTSVDMFYELYDKNAKQTDAAEYVITVTNNGENILSVTDLKICDDPNAAFTPLTKDDVENVLLDMGYSASCTAGHTYEDGFCSVCGIGSVQNSTTGVEYGTVSEALTAAQSGETVILLTDCTTGNTMVTAGVTLDLNGFNLTASNIVAFDTAHIVDNVGTGTLVTGQKNLVLNESNAMVPVYNGSAYVFSKFGFAVRQDTGYTGEGIKINALACPVNMEVVNLLKDGGEDNNIEIVIRLSWDTDQGTGSQEFKFTDEVVAQVYSSNNGNFAGYSEMFTMVVTGFESIKNLNANAVVVSGTNVDYISSTSLSITE